MTERKGRNRYQGKKKQKTKKTTTGKYVCPSCKERFTTRKEANKHQYEKNHSGAIIVEEKVEEKKPKEDSKKTTGKGNKSSLKRDKMNEAQSKFRIKIEAGLPEKTAITQVAKAMGEKEGKIKGWLDTLKGEARRKGNDDSKSAPSKDKVKEEEEDEVEEKGTIHRFVRITDSAYDLIKVTLDSEPGMVLHVCPTTSNNLVYCRAEKDYYAFDYLMFLHEFVEIEMDIGDIMYILEYFSSKKNKLNNKLKIHDISESLDRWVDDVDDGGCITIGYDEGESLSISQIMGRLSEIEPLWMACAGGSWDKPKGVKKPEPKKDEPKALPAPADSGQKSLGDFVSNATQETLKEIIEEEKAINKEKDKVIGDSKDSFRVRTPAEQERFEELHQMAPMRMTQGEWDEYQTLLDKYQTDDEIREDDIPLDKEKIEDVGLQKLFEPVDKDEKKFNPDAKTYSGLDGYAAEQDASSYYGTYYSQDKATTPKKKGVIFSPVYGVDINRIFVDRMIDAMKYLPPEKKD
jgi:hypothetical protein